MTNIYEADFFQLLPDESMHPGGLRLTGRGARLADLTPGMRCADIGCGRGGTCAYLTEAFGLDMTGLDISQALVSEGCQLHTGLTLLCHDCQTLPFGDDSLDGVFLECTLSLIGHDVLTECVRVLKPSGKLILSDLTLKNPDIIGSRLVTAPQLTALMEGAGLTVLYCEDHTPALRTYAAELIMAGGSCAAQSCVCSDGPPLQLKDLSYHLLIAHKPS